MTADLGRNALNFSGGPGALPECVLRDLQQAMIEVPGVGLSVLGISHRSDWFLSVVTELEASILALLGLSDGYRVLFLQGGATQQFAMIPMTWQVGRAAPADYLHSGYWSGKSCAEARRVGNIRLAWSGESSGFHRLPGDDELDLRTDAPYLHYVSNETVEGLQFHRLIGRDDVPRICDMSSDFLSRPADYSRFAMIYAHAQKNIGPAGVTVVVLREDMLADAPRNLPGFLDYRKQIEAQSIYNTPPVFAIYAVLLVVRWLREQIGGLAAMDAANRRKAALLYALIDESDGFYRGHAAPGDRSLMNVALNLPSRELERDFLARAEAAGFSGLGGHRSLGGIRASLYNGLTLAAVERLADFMDDFRRHPRVGRGVD